MKPKSPFLPAAVAVASLIASLVRWWLQDSGNLYTAVEKRFYVPDPDLGWRVSAAHPVWLGLDACAVITAIAVALALVGYVIRKRAAHRSRALRTIAWGVAIVSLAVPIAAYTSGSRPAGARDALPVDASGVKELVGIEGGVAAPGGRYEVVPHAGTSVTAHLTAGGESFDARFSDIQGSWTGDPQALAAPMTGDISVAAASVDTGVRGRSKHARTKYLDADTYPRIEVRLDRLRAAQPVGKGVEFRAPGTLSLIGRTHEIEIAGTIERADDAALARLGLSGTILLVRATFSIAIHETALAQHSKDFAGDVIPISVSLVLRYTAG